MALTELQAEMVEKSFEKLADNPHQSAALFYGQLFELDPGIKPLFKDSNMRDQERKLMDTLRVVVISLDRLDKISSVVKNLGQRHAVSYKVRPEHYTTGRQALIWMLRQSLGNESSEELESAWLELYDTVIALMQEGALATVS